jgi:hypothetical protein
LVREPKQQDICYATQNRQDAVKLMSPQVDMVIVVGSPTSSNSNRLREVARKLGTESYMVDSADELLPAEWFEGKQRVGLTAGASAPDILVQQVIERIKALGAVSVRKMQGIEETVKFPLPKGLRLDARRIGAGNKAFLRETPLWKLPGSALGVAAPKSGSNWSTCRSAAASRRAACSTACWPTRCRPAA